MLRGPYTNAQKKYRGAVISLGLACCQVVDELCEIEDNGELSQEPRGLELFRKSFMSYCGYKVDTPERDLRFHNYEERRFLHERLGINHETGEKQTREVREYLETILNPETCSGKKKKTAGKLIEFFSKMQKECAVSAEYPPYDIPIGVRVLAAKLARKKA